MGSILVGHSDVFFVPFSCHVYQFTIHTSDIWLELQFSCPSNDRNLLPPSILKRSRIPRVKMRKSAPSKKIFLSRIPPLILRFPPPFISTLIPHPGKPVLDPNKRSLETDLNVCILFYLFYRFTSIDLFSQCCF